MSLNLEKATDQELRMNQLLDKLQRWLHAQPEWLDLMVLDRNTRRRTADLVSKELLKLPVREMTDKPNRALRRSIIQEMTRRARRQT